MHHFNDPAQGGLFQGKTIIKPDSLMFISESYVNIYLMGFQPVRPKSDLRFGRNFVGEEQGLLHRLNDDGFNGFQLIPAGVENQFIMDL